MKMSFDGTPLGSYELTKEGFLEFLFIQTNVFDDFYRALDPIYKFVSALDDEKYFKEFEELLNIARDNIIKSIAKADFIKIDLN